MESETISNHAAKLRCFAKMPLCTRAAHRINFDVPLRVQWRVKQYAVSPNKPALTRRPLGL